MRVGKVSTTAGQGWSASRFRNRLEASGDRGPRQDRGDRKPRREYRD